MAEFELRIETGTERKVARLKLFRADGSHLGSNEISLPEHSSALWEGLFDTRRYVERYEGTMIFDDQPEPATARTLLERLGLFLGDKVLGEGIVRALAGPARRVLVVRLPTTDEDVLAAAFARVPWEIAQLPDGTRPQNLVVRAVTADTAQGNVDITDAARAVTEGETLRVLAVYAEAPGARPLAMRREREELRKLFADKILPHRNVEIDVLCHGVTRRRLKEAIRSRHGYHIVHWSGHGHHNALDLQGEPNNCITGESLVAMFTEAGGFIPQIFFLSACHSGAMLQVKDWQSLQRALERDERQQGSAEESTPKAATDPTETKQLDDAIQNPSGYTGTALALLKTGVPQVVAMRYSVGDEYARQLAVAFYGRLLADHESSDTGGALAMARTDVKDDSEQTAYHAVDHVTPLMFGQPGVLLDPARTRSKQMDRLRPKPQPLLTGGRSELDPPAVFVGRGEPLTRLGGEWLGDGGPAVALVQGLAGLGKTVLAAEAVHLWHEKFDYVLAFQAKPNALQFDDFCRQLDQRLTLESPTYRAKFDKNSLNHIHLAHNAKLFPTPEARYQRMRDNLIEALRDEAILLVIDNFENNLEHVEHEAGSAVYACADPAWDELLAGLARDLPTTRSRLLLTSRHRPRALAEGAQTLWIPLGPLPMGEAALFVRSHPELRKLLLGTNKSDQQLIQRLLKVSRGHPLILDRFARLAGDPAALGAALDHVQADGWQQLPDLFDAGGMDDAQRERERKYLEDVAIGSVDLLIDRITPDARRLLRIVTVANEPVSEGFIDGVWQGKSSEEEKIESLRTLVLEIDALADDDPKKQQHLAFMGTEEGKQFMHKIRSAPSAPTVPPVQPLLAELRGTGLLTKEESVEGQATYAFHELVRERSAECRKRHEDETDPRTDDEIRIAYGERYANLFDDLYHENRNAAGEAGRRALVYFVAAGAFDRLGSFASKLVVGVNDPALLRSVVAELEGAIDQSPPGESRWSLRTYVADALARAGQPDQALPFYSEAAVEAEAAENWSDVAAITGNWAYAARDIGDLVVSKKLSLRCAATYGRAGGPEVNVIGNELSAYRIDVMRGEAETALPEIETRLDRVRDWWQRSQAGESVAEAPDRTYLSRVLVSGLDIAEHANQSLERWQACFDLLEEQESAQRALGENEVELAGTRFNLYGPLLRLGRLDKAQRVLEGCLTVFRSAGAVNAEARCLSALANLWKERNEIGEAIALERQALAVRNTLPVPSARAASHDNLGNYLEKDGKEAEAARHHVAALVYAICIGTRELAGFRNLRIRALAAGERYALAPLEAVLAEEEFAALRQFLDGRKVDRAALQVELDRLVEQAHEEATGADDSPLGDMPPELDQLLGPIVAAAAAGQDVEPLLAGLREQLVQAGIDEKQIDGLLEMIRSQLKELGDSTEDSPATDPE
jgi:tetratricopeptide (TPR) repeat protein